MARNQVEATNEIDVTLTAEAALGFDEVTIRGEKKVVNTNEQQPLDRKVYPFVWVHISLHGLR